MPEIKTIPKMRVAFVTNTGPFEQAMASGFDKLFHWLEANHWHPSGPSLAIFPDDPDKVPPEKIKSESCVVVGDEVMSMDDVHVKEIGGFQAATMEYHSAENIMRAYGELYGWLHAQGYRDNGAPLETYLSRPGQPLHAEIAVPIVKATAPKSPKKKSPSKKATPKKKTRARAKIKRAAKKR